ncbi:tetratricopeptide repeat protein [candidate division CSSED10-310 bacterium]|uniref:Tetratricopeptide repeat protein n=1 Tax=candidate division CSSED10-310 bacterium TaxID=2855610 RepID=A0ABV6YWB4_UNCC1
MTSDSRIGAAASRQLGYFFLFTVIGFLIYSNTFSAVFHLDDLSKIVNNPEIRSFDRYGQLSLWLNPRARPVAMLSFTMNYAVHELNVTGYHLVNICIHILVCFLVYHFVRQLLMFPGCSPAPLGRRQHFATIWVTLIFLTHPIQTQAVTYVIQRMTTLAALFYLSALLFYLKARQHHLSQGITGQTVVFYTGTVITGYGAIFTKPVAISLPVVILLLEALFIRTRENKPDSKFLLFFGFTLLILFFLIIFTGSLPKEVESISRVDYLATECKVLLKYMQLMIFPLNQNLDYDFPLSQGFFHLPEMLSLFVLLALLGVAGWCFSRWKLVSYSILWFFITLSIESSIIPIRDVIFEHRLYLPLLGFSILFVSLVFSVLKSYPRVLILLCVVQLCGYSWLTYARNRVWHTERTLWSDVVKKSPQISRAWAALGTALAREGDDEAALDCYFKAVKLNPDDVIAWNNIGGYLLQKGKLEQALSVFQKVLEIKKDYVEALTNVATIYAMEKNYSQAIFFYQKALKIKPMYVEARFNLGVALLHTGDVTGALFTFKHVLYYQSAHLGALCNLGHIYIRQKKYEEAELVLQRAYQQDPHDDTVLSNLGELYRAQGKYSEARQYFQRLKKNQGNND